MGSEVKAPRQTGLPVGSALSHAFANAAGVQQDDHPPSHRNGARTPREDLAGRAKGLISSGHSYGKAAQVMGLPRSTVWDLVNRG
ncbi:MAG: hypothetical protein HY535_04320 [Chloroflexi bacterium]|nr:hypothetical protein [Chloroflexota bacterium]